MGINLVSIVPLQELAGRLVSSFSSWATSRVEVLQLVTEVTQLRLRGIGSNLDGFLAVANSVAANAGFSSLSAELQADVAAISAELTTTTIPLIATASDADDAFSALGSDEQTAVTTPYGLGQPDMATPDDVWATLHPERKKEALQHALVATEHITALVTSLTVTYGS